LRGALIRKAKFTAEFSMRCADASVHAADKLLRIQKTHG
jgi:hypothetical protein